MGKTNSTQLVPLPSTFCLKNYTATYYTKTVLPKVLQSVHDQRPMAGTSKASCTTVPVPTRPRSQNRTYRSRTSKSWNIRPAVPTLPPVISGFFSKLNERLAGRQFTRVQDLPKAVISEFNAIPASEYPKAPQVWLRRP